MAIRSRKMNFLSSIGVEGIQHLCEVVAIFAGVLAVAALIGQTITGRIVNRRQAVEIKKLEVKRVELEAKVSPRRLSGDQKSTLAKLLSGKKGGAIIVSSLLDAESSDFADDFDAALREAKWETMRIRNRAVTAYGVSLGTYEGTDTLPYTQWLSDALTAIKIEHEIKTFGEEDRTRISPYFEKGYLYLVIDKKPPFQSEKHAANGG